MRLYERPFRIGDAPFLDAESVLVPFSVTIYFSICGSMLPKRSANRHWISVHCSAPDLICHMYYIFEYLVAVYCMAQSKNDHAVR